MSIYFRSYFLFWKHSLLAITIGKKSLFPSCKVHSRMLGLSQPERFMPKSPSSLPIEIKISTVVAISTILHSADPIAIDAALKQMTGGVADFFEDEFAVIDVSAIAADNPPVDWRALA